MENKPKYKSRDTCRICGSRNLIKYFDLGNIPLVNSFVAPGEKEADKMPLAVMFCNDCSNSQLNVVVNPTHLFSDYIYHSSVSKTLQKHFSQMAKDIKSLFKNKNNLKCLDIASNDGCLLKEFRAQGYDVIGVEPAKNLSKIANAQGIKTINSFWNMTAAKEVLKELGKVDVITATNVLAHVDDIHSFVSAVYEVLSDNGIFVIEVPYMRELIRNKEFDTMYHEHLSYFLVKPLIKLFFRHKMKICNLSGLDMHGGTIRITAIKDSNTRIKTNQKIIDKFLEIELKEKLYTIKPYKKLEEKAKSVKERFIKKLTKIKAGGKKVAGYGAAAKGNVFVNYCGLDKEDINFIVDDTKDKQGKLYPGTRIPIVPCEWIDKEKPDYLLILAWNFAGEIIEKTKEYKENGGKYIIAIPKLKVIGQ
ncbi:class I SAM-dependent methyltransferase [Candidatus Woesearchaeota archaeon]|nr:class I SAM-dependent methyltransferase [Candidatus Woesearchaeota archaeon]